MRLADCFTDIITYTILLQKKQGLEILGFDQASADMERLNRESEALLEKCRATREDFDLARFAVFAWVDETIMGGSWEGRRQWQGEQLQRRYFQTSDAGELFFQRLNTIGPHQNHVREVYYICLALGFTGQYHNQGDDMLLDQLKTSNLKLITGSSVDLPVVNQMKLFPDSYVTDHETSEATAKKGFSLLTLAAFLVPVGLYGLLFLIYTFVLNNIGETLINRIP
jgi:type VI secretion system protein ImpK